MRVGRWSGSALLLFGCNGKDAGTPTDDTSYSFDCEVSEPFDLSDPFDPIEGHEHECEDAPLYEPTVPTATSYFVGEFHMDDCGTVLGRETWVLFPNPRWEELGGKECRVVWAVTGTREERVVVGSYSLNLSMVVDEAETDCDEIENFEEDAYDNAFAVVYDVSDAGGGSTVYFTPSGNVLGQGEANGNHVTYTSDLNCKFF